jgi:hypothetical protein
VSRSEGDDPSRSASKSPTTIAFYLPQFHPVPENDAWWGNGFTEWANVVRARPRFEGHYQPHIPATLGFYDLRVPEVREAQAALARAHGIDAFCYYHYWFSGRRPFRRVVDEVVASGRPDFPFCFCWANENWTRVWDAAENEVLLRQEYSEADDLEHISYLMDVLRDRRYLHLQGRPLLLVYRVQSMPNPRRTFELWRQRCVDAGLAEPLIVKFDTHGDFSDPALFGCDAAAQFLPHGVSERVPRISVEGLDAYDSAFDYAAVVSAFIRREDPGWRRHECVFPSWDNTPRRSKGSFIVAGNSVELYERWLRVVHRRAGEDGVVFINAWNEWAEGAHLEPDDRNGDGFLRATARVVLGREPGLPEAPNLSTRPLDARTDLEGRYRELYEAYVQVQRNLTALERTLDRRGRRALDPADLEPQLELLRAASDGQTTR